LVFALIMYHTIFGRYIYALGGNAEVVRLAGVSVLWMKVKVYILSGMLS
ncbi:MAG: sugar ABC transporter permease, partial [Desulfobacterales bacterium]|nr:sugar ABC transporter permease [Desulfobacterales bacterium]